MTKTNSTLAALFLAASALSSAAEAGGVRLQFGGPLGSFTAHPHLSSGPGGTARHARTAQPSYKRHVAKPDSAAAVRRKAQSLALAQHQRRAQKIEVAQTQPRSPKIAIERPVMPKPIHTAKLQDTAVTNDAAPVINVPRAPEVPLVGTQSTPAVVQAPAAAATAATAALQPEEAKPTVSVAPDAEPQAETAAVSETPAPAAAAIVPVEAAAEQVNDTPAETAQAESAKTGKSDSMANRICRRFSAVIASLIEVPCE